MENVKLVIWDLDETFWKGTLSDGEVESIQENIQLVKKLTDCGIVNSICSKNNFEKAKEKLLQMQVWDYFVFPSIDWSGKGERIRQIISNMNLRPVNVLFVDDNESNLQEAAFMAEGIMTTMPMDLKNYLNDSVFAGKKDLGHTRLKQYKVLENKTREKAVIGSNEEFLIQSEIEVEMIEDCSAYIERIHEMIHRNNQLNYTKDRITLDETKKLFMDRATRSGIVKVRDKYGDHGIVGCYAVRDNKAEQFVFSCRILGMGVEQFVYAELGWPEINIVGEVAAELDKKRRPFYINNKKIKAGDDNEPFTSISERDKDTKEKLIIYGHCPLRPVWSYIQPKLSGAKFLNFMNRPQSCNIAVALRESAAVKQEWLSKISMLDKQATFSDELFDKTTKYILCDYITEMNDYKYKSKRTGLWFYAQKTEDVSVLGEYEELKITYEDIQAELVYLCENLPEHIKLLVLTCPEVVFPSVGKNDDYQNRVTTNKILEDLEIKYTNLHLIDIRKYANKVSDFFDYIPNHYNREIGYMIATEILEFIESSGGVENQSKKKKPNNSDFPANGKSKKFQTSKGEEGVLECFIRNGELIAKITGDFSETYDIKYEIWRNRYIELQQDFSLQKEISVSITRAGAWKAVVSIKDCAGQIAKVVSNTIEYNEFNYGAYLDEKYEKYDVCINGIDQFIRFNSESAKKFAATCKLQAELSAIGVNPADFFIEKHIDEITVFADKKNLEILLPYLQHSKIKIRNIYTPDYIWEVQTEGGIKKRWLKDLNNSLDLTEKDVVLFAIAEPYNGLYLRPLWKLKLRIYHYPYVLTCLMTKKFFVEKYSRAENKPQFMCVRVGNLLNYGGMPTDYMMPNEKCLTRDFPDNLKALSYLEDKNHIFPPQWDELDRNELKETLQKPEFQEEQGRGYQVMRDCLGKYLNIEDGFRKTVGQPKRYVGTIYIAGDAIAFGCGVKDEDTIASKIQKKIQLPFRVVNIANCWEMDEYLQVLRFVENMKFGKNDIVIFLMRNWRIQSSVSLGNWLNWDAIDKPMKKIDAFPLFKKAGRADYFLCPNAYTKKCNEDLADLLCGEIYKTINLFELQQ